MPVTVKQQPFSPFHLGDSAEQYSDLEAMEFSSHYVRLELNSEEAR